MKKNTVGGLIPRNFKTCFKATIIKMVCHRHKNKHISMEINRKFRNRTILDGESVFSKGVKVIEW